MKLADFTTITFDCYGTLIDWESGILAALESLRSRAGSVRANEGILQSFARLESRQQALTPAMPYADLLAEVHAQLATEWGVAGDAAEDRRFSASIGEWPAFPDTVEALRYLREHFRLVILSNVDRDSFSRTLANQFPGFTFDAIYTAEEIGSYKPDLRNFRYLIEHCDTDLGVKKDGIIHTAQALPHDHVPAKEAGLASAWIERGEEVESAMGGKLEDWGDKVAFSWRFKNMGEMADAVEAVAAKQ